MLKSKQVRPARLIVAGALIAALGAAGARAQEAQSDSPLRSVMKIVGFATDVKPPPDFVQQSRPAEAPPSIPAFNKAPEPPGKVKSAKEVGDIDSELEAIGKRHDALRAAFPPSAKAVAEVEAAKAAKAKSKSKSAQKSPIPSF